MEKKKVQIAIELSKQDVYTVASLCNLDFTEKDWEHFGEEQINVPASIFGLEKRAKLAFTVVAFGAFKANQLANGKESKE